MATQVKLYFSILIAMAVIDFVWIGVIAQKFYVQQFGPVGRITPDGKFDVILWAAVVVYAVLALGTTFFVMPRISVDDSLPTAFLWGALMGFIVYGVYDMTNHGTLNHWPLTLAFVDWTWGTFLGGAIAVVGKLVRDKLLA